MSVRAITSPELTKMRSDGQFSKVFVTPRVPNTIYTARLNTLPSSDDMVYQIAVTGGSGTASNIKKDMKILVGTTAGARDLGICRVRVGSPSLPGGVGNISVGELSHIDWQASCYITITDDYDIFPRHLKIVAGVPYTDYDVAYGTQHTVFEPIVIMGGHRVLLKTGATVSHVRSASGSSVFDGTISTYLWESPNASGITGSTSSSATITYNSAGHFCEYLTITSAGGKTWTGVRYVFVIDASSEPISNIHSLEINETRDGVSTRFEMSQSASLTSFYERAFVIAWSKDYYQGVEGPIGYNTEEARVLSCGRIAEESTVFDDESGTVAFEAKDIMYWLSKVSSFPYGVEILTTSTGSWTTVAGLNVDRAVFDLLHYYSTVTRIADLFISGDTRYSKEFYSTNTNIAAQIQEIAFTSIFAELICNRYGMLYLRVEPQLVPEASRSSWPVIQTITGADRQGEFDFEFNTYEETSQVSLSGVSVDSSGNGTPIFSLSYGRVFATYGNKKDQPNILLSSQEQANSLAGLMMGWDNRTFDSLGITFVGINKMFSCAEYCRASINITSASNPRGISFNGYLNPRKIKYSWDDDGTFTTSIEFQDESDEKISVTGDFPTSAGFDDVDLSFPPLPSLELPPLAPMPMPITISVENQPKKVVIATNQGMFYTETFDESAPTWIAMNGGLSSSQKVGIEQFVVTPSKAMYILTEWNSSRGFLYLMRASGLGGSWTQKLHADAYPYQPSNSGLWGMGIDQFKTDTIGVVGGRGWNWPTDGDIGEWRFAILTGGSGSFGSQIRQYAHRYRAMAARAGTRWYVGNVQGTGIMGNFASPAYVILNQSGAYVSHANVTGSDASTKGVCSVGVQSKAMQWDGGGVAGYNMITATASHSTSINPQSPYEVAFAADGLNGMGSSGLTHTPYKTTDGGASWSSVGGVIPNGFDVWENCGSINRFIFAGGTEIRLTMDNGASYLNKSGNLSTIAPLVTIKAARFIE